MYFLISSTNNINKTYYYVQYSHTITAEYYGLIMQKAANAYFC